MSWFPLRRWMTAWGASPSDLSRVMAGDRLLSDWTYSGTFAVTIDAPPEDVWPWLVQIGYQRGGLYSYDWLDRLFGLVSPKRWGRLPPARHLSVLTAPIRPTKSLPQTTPRWRRSID